MRPQPPFAGMGGPMDPHYHKHAHLVFLTLRLSVFGLDCPKRKILLVFLHHYGVRNNPLWISSIEQSTLKKISSEKVQEFGRFCLISKKIHTSTYSSPSPAEMQLCMNTKNH